MGGLFSKQKKPQSRITEQDKAVLLKQQRDKLKPYQKRIELSLEKDRELAKKCLFSGRNDRARMLLRKKKHQEKLLSNTDSQLENLEKLASDIEFAQVEREVLDGLKVGNTALKKVHEILSIDEIERIMDETKEGVEKQQEIDSILSGALTEDDEDAVLAELDELVALEEADKEKDEEEQVPVDEDLSENLPDVPTDLPEKRRRAEKGYILVTVFSILNCCGLLVLLALRPLPGEPIHDVTTGILLGLSFLILFMISLGVITSRWCRSPPPDNRVDVY